MQDAAGILHWDIQEAQQPSERYDWLSWELTATANEYVVVGTEVERAGTLGQRTFLNTESVSPVQRSLVMRVIRTQPSESKLEQKGKSPSPLALQAVWTAVRGVGPGD